jgi:hypothetical protein
MDKRQKTVNLQLEVLAKGSSEHKRLIRNKGESVVMTAERMKALSGRLIAAIPTKYTDEQMDLLVENPTAINGAVEKALDQAINKIEYDTRIFDKGIKIPYHASLGNVFDAEEKIMKNKMYMYRGEKFSSWFGGIQEPRVNMKVSIDCDILRKREQVSDSEVVKKCGGIRRLVSGLRYLHFGVSGVDPVSHQSLAQGKGQKRYIHNHFYVAQPLIHATAHEITYMDFTKGKIVTADSDSNVFVEGGRWYVVRLIALWNQKGHWYIDACGVNQMTWYKEDRLFWPSEETWDQCHGIPLALLR